MKVVLLQLGREHTGSAGCDAKIITYLKAHFPGLKYTWEPGDNEDDLFSHLFMQKNKLIIIGAYGRSVIGNIFRRSAADVLIRAIDLPIFIAHF